MSKFLPDDISDIEQFLRERSHGHAHEPDIAVYGKPAAWIAIADLITKLRGVAFGAARDMRERCAKAVEAEAVGQDGAPLSDPTDISYNFAIEHAAAAVRGLPIIATDREVQS